MAASQDSGYGRGRTGSEAAVAAPDLPYQPRDPRAYRPKIGLIGCGGISEMHLRAYKNAGYEVAALCSRDRGRVAQRQREFFPAADTYLDYRELLARDDIEVVDITPHPQERLPLLKAAIDAGKHVLSQKPFVLDLDVGAALIARAERRGVQLAVNQNGRWAPHFSYMRHAVAAGLVGQVQSVEFTVHWDHNWIAGSAFDAVEDLLLCDFGMHWFDMAVVLLGRQAPQRVHASVRHTAGQAAKPPLLAQAAIECASAQATIFFNGTTRQGQQDRTYLVGTEGAIGASGVDLTAQEVALYTAAGAARPQLAGTWFEQGFHGTMAELLCAVEEGREPNNSARANLASLALCFAAVASSRRGEPVVPGTVRRLPGH